MIRDDAVRYEARTAFIWLYKFFSNFWRSDPLHKRDDEEEIQIIDEEYNKLYRYYQSYLGHYFRNLYNIVKFIETSEIPDKKFYTNLVRAQLSSSELNLLFYNCLSIYGREKFKPLVEKYALLKNMEDGTLLNIRHKRFYKACAFAASI